MRSFILLAALATTVLCDSIPGLPACAGNCVTSFGSCSQLDVKCICSDSSLISGLACCVSTVCSPADQNATIQFADSLCAGQGITNLPQSATCASTSSATASSGSASSAPSGSSATVAANSTLTSIPASLSSAFVSASSAASRASSSAVAAQSSAAASVSRAISSASASNAAAASSQSAAVSTQTKSSAAMATGAVGIVGAGVMMAGLIAAL